METTLVDHSLNQDLVDSQFPPTPDAIYLNTGSNGRKPLCVLDTINQSWQRFNVNPTLTTFLDPEPWSRARAACAAVLKAPAQSLLITQSTTQGLQLVMQSLLLRPGDELVTTDHEHDSLNTIARFLEETRGIVVRRCAVKPEEGSNVFCLNVLDLVSARTKLVAISEIGCFTGWRPDMSALSEALSMLDVPLLVDGAHVAGQVWADPTRYASWVTSGHKWLGAPNGTGVAYIAPHLVARLEPVWLGAHYYDLKDNDVENLARFEALGTADVVRLDALTRACELYLELTLAAITNKQFALVDYARKRIAEELNPHFRTPVESDETQKTAMLTFNFPAARVKVADLRDTLWREHHIWIQPDFLHGNPGHGMRLSCHYAVRETEIERLITALKKLIAHG